MLISLIRSMMAGDKFALLAILFIIPISLISLSLHELSHAYVALLLGDDTAKMQGRITLNPLKHLDPLGTIFLLVLGFGWARPVAVNPANFKNRKLGMALTALAGPFSNLLLCLMASIIYHLVYTFGSGLDFVSLPFQYGLALSILAEANPFIISVLYFLYYFAMLNAGLCIFNLIPIPPLDGSRILNIILPEKYYFKVMQYEKYVYIVFMILLFTNILDKPLSFLINGLLNGLSYLITLIPGVL